MYNLTPHLVLSASGGTQRLPRLIGEAKAKELIFTARVLNGEEAAEIGLVEYAVPQNEAGDAAFQKALEIAKEIAKKVTLCGITSLVCQRINVVGCLIE